MARLGTWMPFRQASRELKFFTKVEVNEETIRHITEGAGAAHVDWQDRRAAEIEANRPESADGPELQMMSVDGAYIQLVGGEWKEVKTVALGVVGKPQEEKGELVVHTKDLSYYSRMSSAEKFQKEALVEMYERGVEKAGKVCAVTDGAEWIQDFVDTHRADAIRILDFAHAMGYIADVGKAVLDAGMALELFSCESQLNEKKERNDSRTHRTQTSEKQTNGKVQRKSRKEGQDHLSPQDQQKMNEKKEQEKKGKAWEAEWEERQAHELKEGQASRVLQEIEGIAACVQLHPKALETVKRSLHYLKEREALMNYAFFRAEGYPIGSGCVESANKLVVEHRMKGAGMRWAGEHVNPMLALRNMACSNRWDVSWKQIRHQLLLQAQTKRAEISAQRLKLLAEQQKEKSEGKSSISVENGQEEPLSLPIVAHELPATEHPVSVVHHGEVIPSPAPAKQETCSPGKTRPAANHPWRRPLHGQRSAS